MKTSGKLGIIGSGPAGYTAAIYAARADLHPVLYTGFQPGGQLMITSEVENFPGFAKGVLGPDLMEAMRQQAARFQTQFIEHDVIQLEKQGELWLITDGSGDTACYEAIILATGAAAKWLGVPGEKELQGRGVSACATCDGFFFKGKEVAVIGGGDTAMEEATYLAKLCKHVYVVNRSDEYKASKAMLERARNTNNISFLEWATTKQILGIDTGKVTGIELEFDLGHQGVKNTSTMEIDGVFVAIGHKPTSDLVKPFGIVAEDGYVNVKPGSTQTEAPGLFVCGDVADRHFRQAITAAGSGCMAALEAERWLAAKSAG